MADNLPPEIASASGSVRFVVFHRPGPAWDQALTAIEQTGVGEHFAFLQNLHDSGVLVAAGPFPDARGGGMFVTSSGLELADVERIVAEDPAVLSGLITFECRPWLATLGLLAVSQTP